MLKHQLRKHSDQKINDGLDHVLALISGAGGETYNVIEPTSKVCFEKLIELYQMSLQHAEKTVSSNESSRPLIILGNRDKKHELKTAPEPEQIKKLNSRIFSVLFL